MVDMTIEPDGACEDILFAALVRERLADPAPSVPLDELIRDLGFCLADFE